MSRDTVVQLIVIAVVGTVVGGVILAAVLRVPRLVIGWARRHSRIIPRIKQWFVENAAYVRHGFRLQAVIDLYPSDRRASAFIGKRVWPAPPQDSQARRMYELQSRPFQSLKTFAMQVRDAGVPRLPTDCLVLEINAVWPGHDVWVVRLGGDN